MGIAVVIPVRNRAEIVRRTLGSLAAQTRSPEQIILVDNGSTDSTLDTLNDFAARHPNVTVLSEPRPGAPEARNRGLAEVREEYVMFFDSDDVMPRRHVEQVCDELERLGRPDVGAFGMVREGIDGTLVAKSFRGGDLMFQQLFHSILSTQRFVVKTEFLRAAGGWIEQTPVWNDYLLGVRLLCHNPKVCELTLDEPVRIIAQHESITGTAFSPKAGKWEAVLDRVAQELRAGGMERYIPLLDFRRVILAGEYLREGRPDLAAPLTPTLRRRLLARYVAAGGRGISLLARILS